MADKGYSNPHNTNAPGKPRGERKYQRRPQSALECNFGPVLDLSASGIRIMSSRALSGVVKLRLEGRGIDQTLRARVAWSKKISFRVHEVGLEFVDLQELKHLLQWIAIWSSKLRSA